VSSIGAIGPSAALVVAPAIAVPAFRRREPGAYPADEVLDDVPYAFVDAGPARAISSPRRPRLARPSGAAASPPRVSRTRRGGRQTPEQTAAQHAYLPYQEYRGLYLDVWV
jgi:hypothetical protein